VFCLWPCKDWSCHMLDWTGKCILWFEGRGRGFTVSANDMKWDHFTKHKNYTNNRRDSKLQQCPGSAVSCFKYGGTYLDNPSDHTSREIKTEVYINVTMKNRPLPSENRGLCLTFTKCVHRKLKDTYVIQWQKTIDVSDVMQRAQLGANNKPAVSCNRATKVSIKSFLNIDVT